MTLDCNVVDVRYRVLVLFCGDEYRTNLATDDYWLGLYKDSATPGGRTSWLDGNPSTYRNWYIFGQNPEPNENTRCVQYTNRGFKDRDCDSDSCYTCKKRYGNLSKY